MRFLDLCDSNAVDVAEWLFAQDSMPTVEILHFDTHRYEPNHAVRRIIESSGPTIRHLQFDLTFANEIRGIFLRVSILAHELTHFPLRQSAEFYRPGSLHKSPSAPPAQHHIIVRLRHDLQNAPMGSKAPVPGHVTRHGGGCVHSPRRPQRRPRTF